MPRPQRAGDGDYVWVLSLTVGSVVLRWLSRDVWDGVTGCTGRYAGGFESPGGVRHSIDLTGRSDPPSVSVSAYWPQDSDVPTLAALLAQGHRLAGQDAELALLPMTSGAWEDRYVVLLGEVVDLEYGDPDEAISFEIRGLVIDDAAWPPATAACTEITWPSEEPTVLVQFGAWVNYFAIEVGGYTPGPEAVGAPYPVVLGTPGADGSAEGFPAVPALRVSTEESGSGVVLTKIAIVSYGHVEADYCYLWLKHPDREDALTNVQMPMQRGVDPIGQRISWVVVEDLSTAYRSADKYWTSWPLGSGVLGIGGTGGAPTTFGGVCAYLLSQSSRAAEIDPAARDVLDSYGFGGYVDDPESPIAMVQDRVAGRLPAAMGQAPDGRITVIPIRYRATARDVVAALVEGDGTVSRTAPIQTRDAGRSLVFEVRYQRDAQSGEYRASAYSARDGADLRAETQRSRLDCPDVVDPQTAALVASWLHWRDGVPHPQLRLSVAMDVWGWLRPGDVVSYTEPGTGHTAAVALVMSSTLTDGPWGEISILPI